MIETAEIWMFKLVVDEVVVPGEIEALVWIVALYVGLTIADGLVGFADDQDMSFRSRGWLAYKATFVVRAEGDRALVRDYLDRASRGETTPEDPLSRASWRWSS